METRIAVEVPSLTVRPRTVHPVCTADNKMENGDGEKGANGHEGSARSFRHVRSDTIDSNISAISMPSPRMPSSPRREFSYGFGSQGTEQGMEYDSVPLRSAIYAAAAVEGLDAVTWLKLSSFIRALVFSTHFSLLCIPQGRLNAHVLPHHSLLCVLQGRRLTRPERLKSSRPADFSCGVLCKTPLDAGGQPVAAAVVDVGVLHYDRLLRRVDGL